MFLHGDRTVGVQLGRHRPDGGIDFQTAGFDATEMREGDDQPDGAVAAPAEQADVVEKNDAKIAVLTVRGNEQCADDRVGAAGLVDDRGAVGIEVVAEAHGPFLERAAPEIGAAVEYEPRGLTASVGIERADGFHGKAGRLYRVRGMSCSIMRLFARIPARFSRMTRPVGPWMALADPGLAEASFDLVPEGVFF